MEKEERKETMSVEGTWDIGATTWKGNRILEEYTQGLKQKKIIGSLCPSCGKVIVPPRAICGRCHTRMDERVTVSNRGTVNCFVVSPPVKKGEYNVLGMDPVEMGMVEEGEVLIPVYVQFDGSYSNVATTLENVDPKDVYIGMRVQAVWKEETEGTLSDLEAVEPIKD